MALMTVAFSGCVTDTPVSPRATADGTTALASRQSTTNSTILFDGVVPAIAGDGFGHVFSMNDDGTNIRELTTLVSRQGSWAPDGKRVLLAIGDHVSVMNADGTGITQLTFPPTGCGDNVPEVLGKQVVFRRSCGTNGDLYLMNADGTGLTLLATGVLGSPAPSPKGGQVVYWHDSDFWSLNIATGGVTNLTKGGVSLTPDPSFSPSGKQIAFSGGNGDGIYVMNADGTGVAQVVSAAAVGRFEPYGPHWSPDGKRIAFSTLDTEFGNFHDILIVNVDGTGITNITGQTLGTDHQAAVSAWAR